MTADSPYSLEALERQWQNGKAPKLGLQLAEEHRRRGDLAAAIEVLEAGLDAHPGHLSSRVALSRYLVDSDRFSDSLRHLEKIVRADPVHLVANKLMVKAFLGLGKLDQARDKLDIYEMLGEGDAEIEGLRAQVNGEPWPPEDDEASSAPVDEPAPAAPDELVVTRVEELAASVEPPELPEPPSSPAEPPRPNEPEQLSAAQLFEDTASVPLDSIATEPSAPELPTETIESEPFGAVWPAERADGWSDGGGEDIFSVEAGESTEVGPALDELVEGDVGPIDGAEDAAADADADADADAGADGPIERMDDRDLSEVAGDESISGPLPDADPSSPKGATVTLGRLYLEQGDADRAAACFEEVLEREPGNQAARLALASIGDGAVPEASPESSRERSAGGGSLAERKKAVLIAYRSRIRRAVEERI